jgi:16S rRNA (uracil1498-N3)-methyltransferase
MELFYVPEGSVAASARSLMIEGDEFHHLSRVLRKKEGERIKVTDGSGLSVDIAITSIGKRSLEGEILGRSVVEQPATGVTVAISLLKAPARFDFFLEKATELGVSGVIPMMTRRTVSQPSRERFAGRMDRWRNILLSAARQSGRFHLPKLHEPLSFRDALALKGYDLRLIPYEGSGVVPELDFPGKKVLFLIGGEGGFTPGEVEAAKEAGFGEMSFGRTILRAESAGIFAVALVRARLLGGPPNEWL